MAKIDDTLKARDARYGTFFDNASAAQLLKFAMHSGRNWNKLENDQKEALEHIASKIGRLLTGDFNHIDSWHDITGYAKLVENRLLGQTKPPTMQRAVDSPKPTSGPALILKLESEDPDQVGDLSAKP